MFSVFYSSIIFGFTNTSSRSSSLFSTSITSTASSYLGETLIVSVTSYLSNHQIRFWTLTTNTSNDTDSQKAYAKVSGCFIVSQKVLVFNTITIFIKLLFNLNISISRKMGSSILCNISYSSNQLPCNRI